MRDSIVWLDLRAKNSEGWMDGGKCVIGALMVLDFGSEL